MKKFSYAIIALLSVLYASCSNDEIEITRIDPSHDLTLSISTSPLYDAFGRSDYESVWLSSSYNYQLGVFTFVYDEKGDLVEKESSFVKTFQNIRQSFNLVEGDYTIVTVETLVDADNDYKSDYWVIDDVDKLSTIKLLDNGEENYIYWDGVVGVATQKISITGDKTESVTPMPLGSLVQIVAMNFDKSSYDFLGFYTKNVPLGRMLSPNATERYIYDEYNERNVWGYRGYFYKDEFSATENTTIYILESGEINWCFGPSNVVDGHIESWYAYPGTNARYTIEAGKEYQALIRYKGEGAGCDAHMGTYSEVLNWYNNLEPIGGNNLIPDLYMTWGGTVANVQSAMNGYTLTTGSSGRAVAQSDGSYMIDYNGKGKESKIIYYFTSATTGLFEADVQYSKTSVSSSDILTYLNSNYVYLTEESGTYMYCTSDYKTYVLFFEINGVWNVGFVDANYLSNSSAKSYIPFQNVEIPKAVENISAGIKITNTFQNKSIKRNLVKENVKIVK